MNPDRPSAADLKGCRRGAEWAAVTAAAAEVGLFEALAEAPGATGDLADRLGLNARAVEIVVEALTALSLVRRTDAGVELTREGRTRYVDPDSDVWEAGPARHWLRNMRDWLRLDEALRHGGPLAAEESEESEEDGSVAGFMAAMAAKPAEQVERVVEGCLRRRPEAETALDLGGGPGVHSRAFAERGLKVTLVDTPETIEHVAEEYGLRGASDIELVGADFLESLPAGPFDIVLLSNITHIFDFETNRDLIGRLARHQAPGDVIGIMDFVRGASSFAPLFAITMLLKTDSGNTYGLEAYRSWLSAAAYAEVEVEDIDAERQLVTALRAERAT